MTDLVWVISSSVMIAVVTALRAAFGGRLKSGVRMVLWALVLVRLLIPGTLFSSPVGVASVVTQNGTVEALDEMKDVDRVTYSEELREMRYERDQVIFSGSFSIPDVVKSDVEPEEFERIKATFDVKEILSYVWLAGAAVTAGVFLVTNLSFYLKIRRRRRRLDIDCKTSFIDVEYKIPVYVADGIESPFLFGSSIYVDEATAGDGAALRHVLAHEASHYRHRDNLTSVARCLALALHWYNPLVWIAAVLSRRDADLFADDGAIKTLGEDERAEYGKTLVDLTVAARRAPIFNGATMMAGGSRAIFERVKRIAKKPKTSAVAVTAVILVAALALVFVFVGKAEDKAEPETVTEPVAENTGVETDNGKWGSSVDSDTSLINIFERNRTGRNKGSQIGIDDGGKLLLGDASSVLSLHISTVSGCIGYIHDFDGGTLIANKMMTALGNIRVDRTVEIEFDANKTDGFSFVGSFSVSVLYTDGRSETAVFYGNNYKSDIGASDSVCYQTTGVYDCLRVLDLVKGGENPDGPEGVAVSYYISPEIKKIYDHDSEDRIENDCGKWETADRNAPGYAYLKSKLSGQEGIKLTDEENVYVFTSAGHTAFVFSSGTEPLGAICSERIYNPSVTGNIRPGMYYGDIDEMYYLTVISPTLCRGGRYSESVAYILTYFGAYRLEFDITGGRDKDTLDPLDELTSVEFFENEYVDYILDFPVRNDFAYTKLRFEAGEEPKLFVLGKLSGASKDVVMHPESGDADVPFTAILEELGFSFIPEGDLITIVYPDGIGFAELDLTGKGDNGAFSCKRIVDGKAITDVDALAGVLLAIDLHVRLDFDRNAVIIY